MVEERARVISGGDNQEGRYAKGAGKRASKRMDLESSCHSITGKRAGATE